ncbi:MAG: flagellar brake protein [Janthinobacterium lividum]
MTTSLDTGVEDLGPYRVHSRREITALLRSVAAHNQLVRMVFSEGAESAVTSLLDIDEAANMLVLDVASTDEMNQRILTTTNISFETVLEHIRVLFFAEKIELCKFKNLDAFRIKIPETLIRLQRREYFRVPTPASAPLRCTFALLDANEAPVAKHVILGSRNISNGGIAIIDDTGQLDDTAGLVYHNCTIDFPGSPVSVSLEVRNSQPVKLADGRTGRLIGCRFVDMSSAMLALFQRYILKLEREQNARAGV